MSRRRHLGRRGLRVHRRVRRLCHDHCRGDRLGRWRYRLGRRRGLHRRRHRWCGRPRRARRHGTYPGTAQSQDEPGSSNQHKGGGRSGDDPRTPVQRQSRDGLGRTVFPVLELKFGSGPVDCGSVVIGLVGTGRNVVGRRVFRPGQRLHPRGSGQGVGRGRAQRRHGAREGVGSHRDSGRRLLCRSAPRYQGRAERRDKLGPRSSRHRNTHQFRKPLSDKRNACTAADSCDCGQINSRNVVALQRILERGDDTVEWIAYKRLEFGTCQPDSGL